MSVVYYMRYADQPGYIHVAYRYYDNKIYENTPKIQTRKRSVRRRHFPRPAAVDALKYNIIITIIITVNSVSVHETR